jgi:hypothetical protein
MKPLQGKKFQIFRNIILNIKCDDSSALGAFLTNFFLSFRSEFHDNRGTPAGASYFMRNSKNS